MGPEQYLSLRGLVGSVMTPSMTDVHTRLPGSTSFGSAVAHVMLAGKLKMSWFLRRPRPTLKEAVR